MYCINMKEFYLFIYLSCIYLYFDFCASLCCVLGFT